MTTSEFHRLMAYHKAAKQHREHMPRLNGRRAVKNKGNATGQILASSFIKPLVGIERVFPYRIES